MEFKYKIKTESGELIQGIVDANTKKEVVKFLQNKGFYIIEIIESEKSKQGLQKEIRLKFLERVSKKDIALFTKQLAMMTKANISLPEALKSLALQTKNKKLKEQILAVEQEVLRGNPLSQGLAKFPKTFSLLYVNLIMAGETIGKISSSLSYLTEQLEKEIKLKSQIKSAMLYPTFILVFALIAGIVAITRIIPPIATALIGAGARLPFLTRMLVALSDALIAHGTLLLLLLILFCCLFSILIKTYPGKKAKEKVLLSLPVYGNFLNKVYVTRFSQSLSVLLSSGVPIVKSLDIAAKTVDSVIYEEIIINSKNNISKGGLLGLYFKQHPKYFPIVFTQILSIGERTGQINKSLVDINEYYELEVETMSKNFMELLNPMIMVLLGIGVGILMFAIWTPMFEIMDPVVLE